MILVVLQSDVEQWLGNRPKDFTAYLQRLLPSHVQFELCCLSAATKNAVETVAVCIQRCHVLGSIFVKDQDGAFPHRVVGNENYVVGMRLTSSDAALLSDVVSKSFLQVTGTLLSGIQEKVIVSDVISIGGYGFVSAEQFCATYEAVQSTAALAAASLEGVTRLTNCPSRLFMSHVILHMMLNHNEAFAVSFCQSFLDWKTETAWQRYLSSHQNIEVQLEGVLVVCTKDARHNVLAQLRPETYPGLTSSSSGASASSASTSVVSSEEDRAWLSTWVPVAANVAAMRRLNRSRTRITIRTEQSRQDERLVRHLLETILAVPFDDIVFESFTAKSVLVTGYGGPVQHPSSLAFCIPEGASLLGSVLLQH